MSRNYFIVLKNFNKCDYYGVYDESGVDLKFLSGRPLFATSEDAKVFRVKNFNSVHFERDSLKITDDFIETAFEVGEEAESAFIDDNGFEVPVIDDSKKLNAALHLNIGIERRCMIKSISYNAFYAADGFKFNKSQGKVFMNSDEAHDVINKIVCEDKDDLEIVNAQEE